MFTFGIFSVVNRPYLVSQTIPYNVLSRRFLAKPNKHNAFMNKYICVRELMFRLFRDVSLGRLCSNSFIASARTPQHPGAVRLHINAFNFSVSARRVTSPTWGPPPPRKQALSFLEGLCVQIQIFE